MQIDPIIIPESKKPNLFERLKVGFGKPKNRLIIIIVMVALIIIFSTLGFYLLRRDDTITPPPTEAKNETPVVEEVKPLLYQAPLDGLMVDKENADRHPLAVIIENHVDARPQSGLTQASVVYEAITEGGITRFMALYGTTVAEKAGPIRSARTYFVDWAMGYSAYLSHVGGNIDALDMIKSARVLDLDQFAYSDCSNVYCRDYSRKVALEHTMYGFPKALYDEANRLGYQKANNFTIYKFKDEPTVEATATLPESQTVLVKFSSANFDVRFDYDKATNSYKRSLAGKPHLDAVTKEQITAKNVIVMSVKREAVRTRINEDGYKMTTVGSGNADIFMDGKRITATWKKTSSGEREMFFDENGQEIVFNRGKFWICVLPPEPGSQLTVQ